MYASDVLRVRDLCDQLVSRAEKDPEAAASLADGLAKLLESPRARRGGRRASPAFDPFQIYRETPTLLGDRLAELDLEQLRDIVAHYGMDSRRLVMKWKTKERVVEHIVQIVETRSQKGDAFRR